MRNVVICAAMAAMAGAAQADLIAYWDYNASTPNSVSGSMGALTSTAPTLGAGTMSLSSGLAYNTVTSSSMVDGDVGTFSGSTINVIAPSGSGGALAIQGKLGGISADAADNNGEFIQYNINMASYTNLVLTFAGRGTSSGFGSAASPNQVMYSTDGVNYTQLATYESRQTSFSLYTFNFGAAGQFASNLSVRLVLNGATTGSGNNRLDNVQFNATIPTPGTLGLMGLGLVAAGRRRR